MGQRAQLVGQRFSRLTVISFSDVTNNQAYWICKCDCGNIRRIPTTNLTTNHSTSCGCYLNERRIASHTTHGQSKFNKTTPEYNSWTEMKNRCHNPSHNRYYRYGKRGIKVCDRWLNSFENFFADMGNKPSPKHSIDRINNDGNYEPSNCRWATREEQVRNTSKNRWLEANGERMILVDWAQKLKIDRHTLTKRLKKQTFQEIVEVVQSPNYKKKSKRLF